MKLKFRRMSIIVGLGTVLGVILLLLSYRFAIGPQGKSVVLFSLSSVTAVGTENSQCIKCHQEKSPGVVNEYHDSKHSQRGVQCLECHRPIAGQEKMTKEHYNVQMVANPTPNNCAQCHEQETKEFSNSAHGAKGWYPTVGAGSFSKDELAKYHLFDQNGTPLNGGKPNVITNVIGEDATKASCQVCHGTGKKNDDGSFGDCTKCHLRHDFSVSQARKPETCAQCHLGPDHPQSEIYNESAHGAYYQANQDKFNMEAPPGTLTTKDFPAPTCATCHMSGLGEVKGTHDVGARLKWSLAPNIAVMRPDGDQKRQTMNSVCLNCHTQDFVNTQMTQAEEIIDHTNKNVQEGAAILTNLKNLGLLSGPAMSTPIEFTNFELWHHEGRRARFGAVMGGADYVNWHGIYEQEKALVEMKSEAVDMKNKH